jgi:hypothetical protein
LTEAGIGGAAHCIFHVRLEGHKGPPQSVDFAAATPGIVRQWVSGLSTLLHIGSVGIGLQVKQSGGKFFALGAVEGSPSAASKQFCTGDIIEAIDTFPLTSKTSFDEFEALALGAEQSPISVVLDRHGLKVRLSSLSLLSFTTLHLRLRSNCDVDAWLLLHRYRLRFQGLKNLSWAVRGVRCNRQRVAQLAVLAYFLHHSLDTKCYGRSTYCNPIYPDVQRCTLEPRRASK